MSMSDSPKPSKTGGLAGINAGETAICTVGKEGFGLSYRGYTIEDLAAKSWVRGGRLPTPLRPPAHARSQLTEYRSLLAELRGLPDALKVTALELAARRARIRWTFCAPVAPCSAASNPKPG